MAVSQNVKSREWMGLRQLTEYADVSERTLRSWIHSPVDPLPAIRVRGKLLVRCRELDTWLEKHRVRPLAPIDFDTIVEGVMEGLHHGR